jgi:hypothetical protein
MLDRGDALAPARLGLGARSSCRRQLGDGWGQAHRLLRLRMNRLALAVSFLALVSGGCIFREGTAVRVWAESEADRPVLLRVVVAGSAQVYYLGPAAQGWAISFDGPLDSQAEVLDLSCRAVDAIELPEAGTIRLVVDHDLALRASEGDPTSDPFAALPELTQTCDSIRMCPIYSPWPSGVPFPAEPCPGRWEL